MPVRASRTVVVVSFPTLCTLLRGGGEARRIARGRISIAGSGPSPPPPGSTAGRDGAPGAAAEIPTDGRWRVAGAGDV
jgi:hypothetical protein